MENTSQPKEAIRKGYRSLTKPFRKCQEALLRRVISDMERGNIDHCLVEMPIKNTTGVEVWRKDMVYSDDYNPTQPNHEDKRN